MTAQKQLNFTKMVGAGNDFIIIEAKKGLNYKRLAVKACDRTNGIGADGLIILDKSKKSDYRMRIINADGSEAEMCGNGARCLAVYIRHHKKPRKKQFTIETLAGEIIGEAAKEIARVRLSDPRDLKCEIPITIKDRKINVHYLDTGVPHVVIFVEGLEKIDISQIAPDIRFHKKFAPRGANVNFVEILSDSLVNARTYERGVEDETKACGTGSVAAALLAYATLNSGTTSTKNGRMKVRTASGEILDVTFRQDQGQMTDVWLKGSGRFIASGTYFL